MSNTRRLTPEDVRLIRDAYDERLRLLHEAENLTARALGGKFDVDESSIRDICSYRTYRDVI
jgi:hypothetical protein